jgi:hypothetical protein
MISLTRKWQSLPMRVLLHLICRLLVKTGETLDHQRVPEGRAGCENCRLFNNLLKVAGPVALM